MSLSHHKRDRFGKRPRESDSDDRRDLEASKCGLRLPEAYSTVFQRYMELVSISTGAAAPSMKDLLERYQRILKIGEGTFGEVFVVFDCVAKTHLTMKQMRRPFSMRKSSMSLHNQCFREIELLTSLNHPNIIQVVDYHLLADGSIVMLMPVVAHDASTLMRHWPSISPGASKRMPLHITKCIFYQILNGVAYLHQQKVVHRDIKPSNIMVEKDGVVKLIDFGWSRFCAATEAMTGPPCVIHYRPPEVLAGMKTDYDFSVDIWSCGCLLFEMLSGGTHFIAYGCTEIEALASIVDWLGSPEEGSAIYSPRHCSLQLKRDKPSSLIRRCEAYGIRASDAQFLSLLLQLEPSRRVSASVLLKHSWFTAAPEMCVPKAIPLPRYNTFKFVHQESAKLAKNEK